MTQFNFKDYLEKMSKDKRHIQIIALYWKIKDYSFDNKFKVNSALKRDLRAGSQLKGYSDKELLKTMTWLEENSNYKWTLETVHKYIDEDLSKLSRKEITKTFIIR